MYKRWVAWLLCVLLILTQTALADVTLWPELDFTAAPMQLTVKAQAVSHMPFDDTRVEWLNGLLKHVSLNVQFQQAVGETWMKMGMKVDDETVLTIAESEDEQASMVQFSLIPDTTFTKDLGGASALETLMGMPAAEEPSLLGVTMDDLHWIDDGLALMDTIREEWSDSIKNVASKQSISGYGSTTRKLTLTIAAADAESFGQWMAEHCPKGKLADLIGTLTLTGKQTLVWLMDKEGRCHKFTYNGNFNAEGIDKRRLGITWNMARTATTTKDALTIKTPQSNEKNAEYNTFSWKRNIQEKNGAITEKDEFAYTQRINKQKLAMSGTADMKRVDENGLVKLTGTISMKRTQPEAAEEQTDLKLDLLIDESDSSVLGTVGYAAQTDKKNLESAVLEVNLRPGSNLLWQLREKNVLLDGMKEAELTAIRTQLSNLAVPTILRPLVLLPREDTLFLSQELTDEAWEEIVHAAQYGN